MMNTGFADQAVNKIILLLQVKLFLKLLNLVKKQNGRGMFYSNIESQVKESMPV